MKIGQAVLALIHEILWDRTSWGMEDSPLVFAIIPDQYGAFPHYLEVCPFMSDSTPPPPVPGPYLWAYEELKYDGELI